MPRTLVRVKVYVAQDSTEKANGNLVLKADGEQEIPIPGALEEGEHSVLVQEIARAAQHIVQGFCARVRPERAS